MKVAKIPDNEEERLKALDEYEILDTLPEQEFDDLTIIAAQLVGAPIALISLIDGTRQWFKSKQGLGAPETPRDVAFCAHAILANDVFVIEDSRQDQRFHDNPLVTDAPNVIFYAGAPLVTPEGFKIGTICVIDHRARQITIDQTEALRALARQTISLLELRKLNKIAQQALAAKSIFLASMSHEIRTPMNGVIGMTQLLLDENPAPRFRKKLEILDKSGKALLGVVNDILDYSKLEAEQLTLANVAVNLADIAKGVIEHFYSAVDQRQVKLTYNIAPQVPGLVIGDATRINQILLNLIGNAVKFTRSGSVHLEIGLAKLESETAQIQFSVKDTGIGIPLTKQDDIFKAFSQANLADQKKGSGLGLFICRELCHIMGGEIRFVSAEGEGSEFIFEIPLELGQNTGALATSEGAGGAQLAQGNPSPKELAILVAEDNEVNKEVISGLLGKLGYSATIVSNGREAVTAALETSFDVILMDCHMPVLDGFDAAREICKKIPLEKRPQIIAVSASVLPEEVQRCFDSGMTGFVSKPINKAKLKEMLESTAAATSSA